jgi:symplekin
MIEEIGTRHVAHISTMVPVLLALLRDSTPAVARRAITSGSNIFRTTLEQVASQVHYSSILSEFFEKLGVFHQGQFLFAYTFLGL